MKSTLARQALAAAALAATLVAAPQSASAAVNYCTHSSSVDGWINITRVDYDSGRWAYVGSSLMHVHTSLVTKINTLSGTQSSYINKPSCGS